MQKKGHGSQSQRASGSSANIRAVLMPPKQKMGIAAQTIERDVTAEVDSGTTKMSKKSSIRTQEKGSITFRL